MTIQEALNKVRDLKAEASKVIAEADEQKTRTYYLDVDRSTYPILKRDTMDLINTYSDLQRQIHQLKFQIQATNVSCGITQLIQELDFLTSQHNALERFGDETQVTDPILVGERFGSPSSSNTYKTIEATYDIETVLAILEVINTRISALKLEIQRLNWETPLIAVSTLNL